MWMVVAALTVLETAPLMSDSATVATALIEW